MKPKTVFRLTTLTGVILTLVILIGGVPAAALAAPAAPLGATDGLPGIRFLHVSTTDNVAGNSTYLDHPLTNGDPNAIVFVTQNLNAGGGYSGTVNEHEIGVWYDEFLEQWAVFNQDGADLPVGSDYNVLIPGAGSGVFVQNATAGNITGNSTFLDHPLINDNPDALLFITQNWNPGGGGGVYNDHPVGVWYQNSTGRWAIFNEDMAAMPEGASFNVLVAEAGAEAFVHYATPGSIVTTSTLVDYAPTNGDTHALLFVTQNWDPGGTGVYNPYAVTTSYNPLYDQWAIGNLEPGMTVDMTEGAAFNVLVVHTEEPFLIHTATASNSFGNWTLLNQSLLNSQPNAVALITQNWNPHGVGDTYNAHPVGVWYREASSEWAVFNEDSATMPEGAAFNVLVPNMDAGVWVQTATAANTTNNSTFLQHPLTDNDPDAIVFVTQNWNPGGGTGSIYNAHPVGVWYNDLGGDWAVFNEDNANMPAGASFNVYVPLPDDNVFVHTATAGNTVAHVTYLDHPLLNGNPHAKILITQNWNPGGGLSGVYNAHPAAVAYDGSIRRWVIFNEDLVGMPAGAAFNVLVAPYQIFLPLIVNQY